MGYIYALVHNMNDAEDIYQQTSVILWRKFEEYEAESDFFRWASIIARYEVLNFFRTSSTRSSKTGITTEMRMPPQRYQRIDARPQKMSRDPAAGRLYCPPNDKDEVKTTSPMSKLITNLPRARLVLQDHLFGKFHLALRKL